MLKAILKSRKSYGFYTYGLPELFWAVRWSAGTVGLLRIHCYTKSNLKSFFESVLWGRSYFTANIQCMFNLMFTVEIWHVGRFCSVDDKSEVIFVIWVKGSGVFLQQSFQLLICLCHVISLVFIKKRNNGWWKWW